MQLAEYVAREGRGTLAKLQRATGLAYTTVFRALKRPPTYETAQKLSLATGGSVSIDELCTPPAREAQS